LFVVHRLVVFAVTAAGGGVQMLPLTVDLYKIPVVALIGDPDQLGFIAVGF
jgi:hypothetical protein